MLSFIFDDETVLLQPSSSKTSESKDPGMVFGSRNAIEGRNVWDSRPTKEQGKQRIDDFRESRDRVVRYFFAIPDTIIDTEIISDNIPWWVVVPFYVAPYVAEGLIELDPMDRFSD